MVIVLSTVPPATGHDLIPLLRSAPTTSTNVALRQAAAARLQPGQSWTRLVPPSAGHRGFPGSYNPDLAIGDPPAAAPEPSSRRSPWPLTHLKRPASFAPLVEYPKYTGANTRTGPFTTLASPPLRVVAGAASRQAAVALLRTLRPQLLRDQSTRNETPPPEETMHLLDLEMDT
ncbi:hypothetical protein HPB50_014060 [Hyalomma asiaticum]|uniref:Uncharacterized protein n=1 Tax=Hyalomma asiaticum TaxID=266040 RepID=A0ACB7SJI4_HYAAI|nr:hypothetical protein HPB50_014060 [Hyalomma asiaticum]